MTLDEKIGVGPALEQAPDDALRAMVATIVQVVGAPRSSYSVKTTDWRVIALA